MFEEYTIIFHKLVMAVDALVIGACFFWSYYQAGLGLLFPLSSYLWIALVMMFLWVSLCYLSGLYSLFRLQNPARIILIIFRSTVFSFLTLTGILLIFKADYVDESFVLYFFASAFIAQTGIKTASILIMRFLRKKGFNSREALIVGTGPRAQKFIQELFSFKDLGVKLVGLVDDNCELCSKEIMGVPVLGKIKDIPKIIREKSIAAVFFVLPRKWLDKMEDALQYCDTVGVPVIVVADLFHLKLSRGSVSHLFGIPLLIFENTPKKAWQLLFKRVIDIIFSTLILIVSFPVLLAVALLIKISSKGPVIFRQLRAGHNGKQFLLYKFRTMIVNAEELRDSLLSKNEMDGPVFKIAHDPRVTWLGRFLRKLSLDEFPQFWNVLKGDMSLVGSRPALINEVARYDDWQRRRLSMRPGITGIWQVSGRNKINDFNIWMKMDLEYIDNWSLWLDIKLLFKTVFVVVFGIGAE